MFLYPFFRFSPELLFREREEIMQKLYNENKHKKSLFGKVRVAASAVVMAVAVPMNVYAAESVTTPLTNLKTLILSIIGAVGIIILAKNVMEFAQSYQQQDSSSMNSAIKGIVAGLIMAAISSVITFLGL